MYRAALIGSVCLALFGCGSSAGPPQVRITEIAPGGTITARTDYTFPLHLSVTNFLVQQPGLCGSTVDCGQVYLNIDGHACDQGDQPYNAIALSAPASKSIIVADFSFCPPANLFDNSHELTVSLHVDSGAEVLGPDDEPVETTLPVVVTVAPNP